MTDDLHDIDDLFRGGIEGHAEEVPPSVWEAVSNDLDKKQASYYKDKYDRLKKFSVLLLLLCFLGGVYVVYKASDDKGSASARRSPAPVTTERPTPPGEKKNGGSMAVNGGKDPGERLEQGKEKAPANDTSSASLLPPVIKEQRQMQKGNVPEAAINGRSQPVINRSFDASVSSPIARRKKERSAITKQPAMATYPEQQNNKVAIFQRPLRPSPPLYKPILLPAKDYDKRGINLHTLAANARTILPQTASVSKSKKTAAHGFSLTAFAAPNASFERLEDNDHLAGPGRNRQEAHREEQENYSFSAGLALSYNLTAKLSLQSGLSITSSSIAVAPKTVYARADNNGRTRYELHCSSGYAYINPKSGVQLTVGDSAQTSGTNSKLTYVRVPAFVSYRFSKGRFSLSPGVGAGLNFLTSGKTTTSLADRAGSESATTAITGLKPTYVDGYFGVGIDYDISRKLSIGIRPNARLALTPINKETPVQSYQNFLSVETGVRIKL